MPFELVGVSRCTRLVLRFNFAGHMWEIEVPPVECTGVCTVVQIRMPLVEFIDPTPTSITMR